MGRDSTLDNAMSQSQSFGLTPPQAAALVEQVIRVVDTRQDHFTSCGVTQGDIAQLAERIDGEELVRQRRAFSAADYQAARARKPRRGPFSP